MPTHMCDIGPLCMIVYFVTGIVSCLTMCAYSLDGDVFLFQYSKKSEDDFVGRMDGNIKVVFPGSCQFSKGDYVVVKVTFSLQYQFI